MDSKEGGAGRGPAQLAFERRVRTTWKSFVSTVGVTYGTVLLKRLVGHALVLSRRQMRVTLHVSCGKTVLLGSSTSPHDRLAPVKAKLNIPKGSIHTPSKLVA